MEKSNYFYCKMGSAIGSKLFAYMLSFLFCIIFASNMYAQQEIKITGKVIGTDGEPIIGAAIQPVGLQTGTISDIDGNFTISAPSNGSIKVSYVGYTDQTVKINNQTSLTVVLEEDTELLDEVVVIGYGTVKKRDLTGAVTSVKSDVITMAPTANAMEALQGRVAGLDITRSSGQAGSGVGIQLRGNRSMNYDNDGILQTTSPLFLIDGLPGSYSSLNPNDIESIEVLKDASSTAIYGSSGANGVVIITTKSGKGGKVKVNFDSYLGLNGWSKLPKLRQGEAYINTIREANEIAGTYTDEESLLGSMAYEAYKKGQNINWMDALTKTGVTQNYSVSLSEGTDKKKNYFSLNYSQEDGQYEGDSYKVFSSTYKTDYQVKKWIAMGISVQGSYKNQSRAYSKLDRAFAASPYGSLYDEDGNLDPFPVAGDTKMVNLLLNQNQDAYVNSSRAFNLYVTPYVRITPLKGLNVESRINATLGYNNGKNFIGFDSYQFYDQAGISAIGGDPDELKSYTSASINNSHSYQYKWENIFTYNFNVQEHDFTLTGVTTYGHSQTDTSSSNGKGISSNIYKYTNLGLADIQTVSSGYTMSKGIGFIGRINYSFMGRYLLSASARHEGSSMLAEGNKWHTFPAINGGWRISDEAFMESTKDWLDNAKIRIGYGMAGTTSGIEPFKSKTNLTELLYTLAGEKLNAYQYPDFVSNQNLTWEKSKSTNIGLDLSFLNGRIDLAADYYVTNTEGVIWKQVLPITNGGVNASTNFSRYVNLASTRNKGLELALTTRNVETKDFSWTSTITYSTYKEKITSLGDGTQDLVETAKGSPYALKIGEPLGSFYNYKLNGVWQLGEEADAAAFGAKPGHLKVNIPGLVKIGEGEYQKTIIDENGEEIVTVYNAANPYAIGDNDKQIIGHSSPDWTLGFQNTFTWKDFDLSIYMYARYGQMIKYDLLTNYDPTGKTNFPTHFDYWTPTNPSNDFPGLDASLDEGIRSYKGYTGLAYVDGSFFKIKNITLGYTMPKALSNKLQIEKLRVYGTITNPLVKAKSHLLKDYDPEMNGSLDFPLTKQLVFGVNFSF